MSTEGWGSPPGPPPYLVDVRDHVSGRAPVCADLHGQGLTLLRKDTHPGRADQQGHHTEPLLFQRVEQHHVPAGRGRLTQAGFSWATEAETEAKSIWAGEGGGETVSGARVASPLCLAWSGSPGRGIQLDYCALRQGIVI